MIARCHYTNDYKSVYIDDYVIRLPKLKSKSFIVIYHNVPEMDGLDFYNQITGNLSEYKTIYTSEPNVVYCTPLDESKPCDSSFDIRLLDSIIEKICVCVDTLYVVLVFTPKPVDLVFTTTSSAQLVNFSQSNNQFPEDLLKHKIKIQDTNISKDLIGSIHEFENSELVIFVSSSSLPNFSNWIKYTFEGFEGIVETQNLVSLSCPDIEAQILGLKSLILVATKEKFDITKRKFLHTIAYYKAFVSNKFPELISSANILFSMIQNSILCENLSGTNLADNLFSKSLKITPPFITWKQSKTFTANKIKAGKQTDSLNPSHLPNPFHLSNPSHLPSPDPLFIKSLEQYTSSISLSNWYEEYENNSCLGLLLNIQTSHPDRMGWTTSTINVQVTSTLIGRDQIFDGHEYFWNQNNRLDNGKMETNLISGSGIGSGNSLLPLYINKFHWEIAKKYLEEQISICITQNPYLFKPTMLALYSHVLIKIISELVTSGSGCSTPLIKSLIWVGLTMKKLGLDLSLGTQIQSQDIMIQLSNYFFAWVGSGSNPNPSLEIFKIYENITRYNMKKDFRTKKDIGFLSPIDILNVSINKPNISDFENFVVFTRLPIHTQLNNLIFQADESYGWIDDLSPDLIELKNTIKSNEKFFKITDMFGKLDFSQAILVFTFQCFLSRTSKLKNRLESTIGLIDFTDLNLTDQMVSDHLHKLNRIIG